MPSVLLLNCMACLDIIETITQTLELKGTGWQDAALWKVVCSEHSYDYAKAGRSAKVVIESNIKDAKRAKMRGFDPSPNGEA